MALPPDATNLYVEIGLETDAMALCDASESGPTRRWKKNKGLMTFLRLVLNARR